METLPSKELMGKVLLDTEKEEICTYELCWGRDIKYSIRFKDRNNDGTFNYEYDEINIYEFDHKCKNWATSKGYQFKVYIQTNGEEEWQVGKCGYGWDLFTCKSIQEACEYIMEQTK